MLTHINLSLGIEIEKIEVMLRLCVNVFLIKKVKVVESLLIRRLRRLSDLILITGFVNVQS